jgi:hypothetical protein
MSFRNSIRDFIRRFPRFRKHKLMEVVEADAKEEADRLANVAATIFSETGDRANTPAQSTSISTTMAAAETMLSLAGVDTSVIEPPVTKPEVPPAVVLPKRECILCTERFEGEEVLKKQFPFECGTCSKRSYCVDCISTWFVDACRNESKMPPKCCYAIPVAIVATQLNVDQVSLS